MAATVVLPAALRHKHSLRRKHKCIRINALYVQHRQISVLSGVGTFGGYRGSDVGSGMGDLGDGGGQLGYGR